MQTFDLLSMPPFDPFVLEQSTGRRRLQNPVLGERLIRTSFFNAWRASRRRPLVTRTQRASGASEGSPARIGSRRKSSARLALSTLRRGARFSVSCNHVVELFTSVGLEAKGLWNTTLTGLGRASQKC